MKYVPALAAACLFAASTVSATSALAASGVPKYCGDMDTSQMSDYRKGEFSAKLQQVERTHFTEEVESGARGPAAVTALDAVLASFPNHIPALNALTRLAIKEKRVRLAGSAFPVECYFDRAQRFARDDPAVYATYGSYLFSLGLNDKSVEMNLRAAELDGKNAVINYNLGLAYFKLKDYTQSNKYAQRAYKAGFPLPGLRTMLQGASKWVELPDEPASPTPADSTAAAGVTGGDGADAAMPPPSSPPSRPPDAPSPPPAPKKEP